MASGKRYGGQVPISIAEYHESRTGVADLPQTTATPIPITNTPNIFSYRSHVFVKHPELIQRCIKATKADVDGVGGHVVAGDEAKSAITKCVLENNSVGGHPVFMSLIVTHTGDDVPATGIAFDGVDMSAIDEPMCRREKGGGRV